MAVSSIESIKSAKSDLYTPVVETAVFDDAPDARFWIGKVAILGDVLLEDEYKAARQLRANVYIDKMNFLPESYRQVDGGESDEDDDRSIQFAVIENRGSEKRLVGTSRLIVKRDKHDLLPVERLFPEAFPESAPVNSTEASRFIAEHPDKFTKHLISLSEIRAMDMEALARGYEPVYAVIEEKLGGMFDLIGLPFRKMTEVKYLEEYATPNIAIEIDPKRVAEEVKKDITGQLMLSQFFESSIDSRGLGFYGEDLQNPVAA